MARQPKRSAFALTSFNYIHTVTFFVILINVITKGIRSEETNDSITVNAILSPNANIYISNSSQLKFGDRILPRYRQIETNHTSAASSVSANVNTNIENNINSNYYNSDNEIKSSVTDDQNNQYIEISDENVVNSLSGAQENFKYSNNRDSDASNNNLPSIATSDVGLIPVMQQKGKQKLQRRNDEYIEIDHDLVDNINVSKADRLIEMSTEFFIVPSSTTTTTVNPSDTGQHHRHLQQHHQTTARSSTPRPILILAARTPPFPLNGSVTPPTTIVNTAQINGLRKEPWVVPVLVLASLCMIMMAAFEIFVLFKAWRTSPSRRHLFLGQMLLLGLFACAGLGAVLTATPTIVSCATIRFGVGVAYALVFAALLVKCVFLISLNGGVYLPAPYQGLLLLFAVLIQVAIGAQWLVTQPPDIEKVTIPMSAHVGSKFSMIITSTDITRLHSTTVITLCKTQFSEMLLSLIYIAFLIIFVAVLAIKSRGIRDNYREATYIGLAIGGAIPIWLGWALCGFAVADRHKDACLAFGLVATSATVFLVMFMPKGRQLAAMGKEGLYVEDREEQFSSLSRAGSGYSPSFFHFKPIKYGVMSAVQNSTTNTANGTNSKHAATLGADRVALVAAAPPSYTRMYHYFPAHMTHPFCFYPTPPPPPPPLSPPLKSIGNQAPAPAQLAQTIRYPGLFMRPEEANLYTTLEPTLSTNPNVYFQRSGGVHPGMMY